MHTPEIRYYSSFGQDFTQSPQQQYRLPEDYRWIRTDLPSRLLSGLTYGLALIFSSVCCRLFLHVRIKGADRLRKGRKKGGFIYANHTLPVGDVFDPALACFPGRIYTLASPANMGIPVIGKILPWLGALPLSDSIHGTKQLTQAVEQRISQGHFVVIYPEAHVWEYCADIRPFSQTAFKFPAKLGTPCYTLTSTFQKRRLGKKPRVTIYADGPFYPPQEGSVRERSQALAGDIRRCMEERSKLTTYRYIEYRHISEKPTDRE